MARSPLASMVRSSYPARPGYAGLTRFAYARRGYDEFRVPVAVRRAKISVTVVAPTIYDR